MPTCIR